MSNWLQGEPVHHLVTIAGRVIESDTGAPMRSALVKINGRPEQACTPVDGHFHFVDLPAGKYELLALAHGYQEITQIVKLTKTKPQILDVNLSMQRKDA